MADRNVAGVILSKAVSQEIHDLLHVIKKFCCDVSGTATLYLIGFDVAIEAAVVSECTAACIRCLADTKELLSSLANNSQLDMQLVVQSQRFVSNIMTANEPTIITWNEALRLDNCSEIPLMRPKDWKELANLVSGLTIKCFDHNYSVHSTHVHQFVSENHSFLRLEGLNADIDAADKKAWKAIICDRSGLFDVINQQLRANFTIVRQCIHEVDCSSKLLEFDFVSDAEDIDERIRCIVKQFASAPISLDESFTDIDQCWWANSQIIDNLITMGRQSAGTPLYVYNTRVVAARASALKRNIPSVHCWFYAIKANSTPEVINEILRAKMGLECVSISELRFAIHMIMQFKSAAEESQTKTHVLFTPNFCPLNEYEDAFELATEHSAVMELHIVIDGTEILHTGKQIFAGKSVGLRIDTNIGAGHHSHVVTAGPGQKFGCPIDQVRNCFEVAHGNNVHIQGLHSHSGSGIKDSAVWAEVLEIMLTLAKELKEAGTGSGLSWIDIGGGLGVQDDPNHAQLYEYLSTEGKCAANGLVLGTLEDALSKHSDRLDAHGLQLWMEPGRYCVANAGALLAEVTQIRHKAGRNFLGISAGMHSLIRPMLYKAYHPIVNLSRSKVAPTETYTVVGPICESGDVVGTDRCLPSSEVGDVVLVGTSGAYGYEMSSRYNMRMPALRVVLQ